MAPVEPRRRCLTNYWHRGDRRQPSRWRDLAIALIAARVIDPQSKLATVRALAPESAVSTLGEMLRVGTVDQHELYAAMDWLIERQATIEQRLAKRHLEDHTLVLYDLTSSYLEGSHCPLARRGHSRDGKKGTLCQRSFKFPQV